MHVKRCTHRSALHYAQERGNAEVVELLLKRGASPHIADPQGRVVGTDSVYSFSVPQSVRQAISKMCNDLRRPPPMM
jgi:Ankyrin repeat